MPPTPRVGLRRLKSLLANRRRPDRENNRLALAFRPATVCSPWPARRGGASGSACRHEQVVFINEGEAYRISHPVIQSKAAILVCRSRLTRRRCLNWRRRIISRQGGGRRSPIAFAY